MIVYNVTVAVDKTVQDDWLQWMKKTHILDVMQTKCFLESMIMRIGEVENPNTVSYAIQYKLENQKKLDHYFEKFASALQAEHQERFGDRCPAFRTVMEVEKHFIAK